MSDERIRFFRLYTQYQVLKDLMNPTEEQLKLFDEVKRKLAIIVEQERKQP